MANVEHPEHRHLTQRYEGGPWEAAKPLRAACGWKRWCIEYACRRSGGHWWHPGDGMIDWFCCQCGAERDGCPKDGR